MIGSGIFGLPSILAGLVGRASPLAYLIAAAGIGVIMACFAEVASQFRESGGPYLYARAALGQFLGIQMGWLTGLARLTATAGNANLFVIYLAEFWPRVKEPLPRALVIVVLLGILATVNYRGVSAGAQLSNFFTVAKLLPLLVFLAAGLLFLLARGHEPSTFRAMGGRDAWLQAVLLLVYAYGGFEGAIIVTGEVRDPRGDAPFAFFVALATVAAVFTLIQVVVVGVLPDPTATDRPLAAAARQFLGPAGAVLMAVGALIAVYGILSSMMLYTPRLAYAFAEQKDLPRILAAVHPRFRTPHVSIVLYTLLATLLAVAGSFRWNVTLSAVARLFTYAAVCAALFVLRKKQPGASAFRLPAGRVLAWLGIVFSAILLTQMGRGELAIIAVTVAIAFANWLWARRRAESPQAPRMRRAIVATSSKPVSQCQKPTGWLGRFVLWKMNSRHSKVTKWGLAHISIEKHHTILDAGCGGGGTISKLAATATQGKVYGIDYSEESVAASKRTNARWIDMGRVEVRHGSVSQLPFPDGMFDLVTAVETHFWWPNLPADMREIFRVLKPGGKLIIIAEVYKGANTTVAKLAEKYASRTGMTLLSVDEHRGLFAKAGYTDVQVIEERDKGWICGVGRKS